MDNQEAYCNGVRRGIDISLEAIKKRISYFKSLRNHALKPQPVHFDSLINIIADIHGEIAALKEPGNY